MNSSLLWKKFFVVIFCFLLLELSCATTARGDMELDSFVYTGYLHFPSQIGGLRNYTHDCFTSGSTFRLITGYLGLEVDLMTGVTWDEWDYEYESSLPLLWSGNLLFYPFSQTFIAPYFKMGYGGFYTRLELEDFYQSGYYTFSCSHFGGGIAFRGGSGGNYVFIEYIRSFVNGHGVIADFALNTYKAGYVIVISN